MPKPASVEVLHERVAAILRLGPPTMSSGLDPYLEIAARAMRATYVQTKKKFDARNAGVVALRTHVKKAVFSVTYGDGMPVE